MEKDALLLAEAQKRIELYRHQRFRREMADIAADFITNCPPDHGRTLRHSLRVALLAEETAVALHLDGGPAFCGGVVHDWGKLDIEAETLYRAVADPADYARIKAHTINGHRQLMGKNWFLDFIASTHHILGLNGYGVDFDRDLRLLEEKRPGTRWYVERIRNIIAVCDYIDAAQRPTAPLDGSGNGGDLLTRMRMKYSGFEAIIETALGKRSAIEHFWHQGR